MKRHGFTLVELLVVIAIIALLMGILMPALARVRQLAFRLTCGTNLSGLGKAMMLYANDYSDELPKSGGRSNTWAPGLGAANWVATTRLQAYGMQTTESAGSVSLSSNLYLLIRHAECTPKMFVCKGESDAKEFALKLFTGIPPTITDIQSCFDFGPGKSSAGNETYRFCSYSYHLPFGSYALTTSSEAGMAVAADRNPWLPTTATLTTTFASFIPDLAGSSNTWKGTADQAKIGNSLAHQSDGQNVLFIDTHVEFEKRSFVGIENDNVYTRFNSATDTTTPDQKMVGLVPVAYNTTDPGSKRDSYLVNDTAMGSSGGGGR